MQFLLKSNTQMPLPPIGRRRHKYVTLNCRPSNMNWNKVKQNKANVSCVFCTNHQYSRGKTVATNHVIFICNLFRRHPYNSLSYSQILLYADDILFIDLSISELQRLYNNCERDLQWLDMRINVKKSHCLRIGPRFNRCKKLNSLKTSCKDDCG